MQFTQETKLFLGILCATVIIIISGIFMASRPAPKLDATEVLGANTVKYGSKNAKISLVEFSDFQCPACKAYSSVVEQIKEKYPDKVIIVYRHFPLQQHQYARLAAVAAEAAGQQGKFWEMAHYLFENQELFSNELIMNSYSKLGLDKESFEKATHDKKIIEKINDDQSAGLRFGVQGTPTFFLNGRKLSLLSTSDLMRQVEEAIGEVE
jgi:protein-disulfide isomerase